MTEEMKSNDATRYVVVNISESGSISQDFFPSEGAAREHAEVEAAGNEGSTFAVFQKVGSARLEPKVTWKGAAR
tara:strand:+ start:834 stop:1055 length:222 start_codon:yes stop_codon:yes gene_type:complete